MTREQRLKLLQKRQNEKNDNAKIYAYQIPSNVPIYKVKEGRNLIDIIPYRISNPDNPAIKQGFSLGDPDYCQIIHTHMNVGPNNNQYLCEAKMFGKACPMCKAQKDFWDIGDNKSAKSLYPIEHGVYNVLDLLEPEKGMQVWRVSTFWVENELSKLAAMKSKRSEPIIYGDHETGWSIEFFGMEDTYNKRTFYHPKNFNFVKREKQYDDTIIEKSYPIDQYYHRVDYAVMEADYLGLGTQIAEETKETEIEKPEVMELEVEEPKVEESVIKESVVEEPPKRRRRKKITEEINLCPFNHPWGDCDKHKDCEKCEDADYNKCADIQDRLV